MQNLFIFGAGASKLAGAPLMNDFFDTGDLLKKNGIIKDTNPFNEIIRAFEELQVIYQKSNLNIDNFEDFLGAIEMGNLINKLPGYKSEERENLKSAMKSFIVQTIERSMLYKVINNRIMPPEPYNSLIHNLKNIKEKSNRNNPHHYSFITFNYDLALDFALAENGIGYDYCLNQEVDITKHAPPLLKIHGSINWGKCDNCKNILPYHVMNAKFDIFKETKTVCFDLGSKLSIIKHCDKEIKSESIIVPPTWNKTQYSEVISHIWEKAATELEKAENIFIIGYSLPPSDIFFKYLYSLGVQGKTQVKNIVVINPDENVEPRFKELFGGSVARRYRFYTTTFENSIEIIVNTLKES